MGKHVPKSSLSAADFPLAVLNGKWTAAILYQLKRHPCRYCELRASIPGLSDKVLTQRLHDLVDAGLASHRPSVSRPTCRYALTPGGKLLHGLLEDICAWGRQHAAILHAKDGIAPKFTASRRRVTHQTVR